WLPYSASYRSPNWDTNSSPMGSDWATNPYVRMRIAFVNRPPVMVGITLWHNIPIVHDTPFTVGVGLPLHFVAGHRVRFETGVFTEFMINRDETYYPLQIPLRINFQVTDRLWLGIRSGIEDIGYRFDSGWRVTSPLGFQGGVRVVPRLDIWW